MIHGTYIEGPLGGSAVGGPATYRSATGWPLRRAEGERRRRLGLGVYIRTKSDRWAWQPGRTPADRRPVAGTARTTEGN